MFEKKYSRLAFSSVWEFMHTLTQMNHRPYAPGFLLNEHGKQ